MLNDAIDIGHSSIHLNKKLEESFVKNSLTAIFWFIVLAITTHFTFLYILGSKPTIIGGISSSTKGAGQIQYLINGIRIVCLYGIPGIFCIAAIVLWVYAKTTPEYTSQVDYYNNYSSFGEWS